MQASEKLFLQTVGRFVGERFKSWAAPVIGRIEKLELLLAAYCQREADVQRMIESTVANYLVTQAQFGRDDVSEMIAAAIEKIPAGPPGKDGANGVDGADGKSVAAADIQRLVDVAVVRGLAGLPDKPRVVGGYIDRSGDLYFNNSDGSTFEVGHVVGKDADQADIDAKIKAAAEKYPPPKDGKDGFDLTDFDLSYDGERTFTAKFASGDKIVKVYSFQCAMPLYRGVWREGKFERGDCVTHEGSAWIALADTDTRPGTPDCHWQLAIKRGRDGKEGKEGKQGAPGKDGRSGRDLTQMGFDGRKY